MRCKKQNYKEASFHSPTLSDLIRPPQELNTTLLARSSEDSYVATPVELPLNPSQPNRGIHPLSWTDLPGHLAQEGSKLHDPDL